MTLVDRARLKESGSFLGTSLEVIAPFERGFFVLVKKKTRAERGPNVPQMGTARTVRLVR